MTHAAHLNALEQLQRELCDIYRVESVCGVGAFVLDEEALGRMHRQGAVVPRPGAREEVFVLDDGHEVSVAVYLDERAREAAADAVSPSGVTLGTERFADFCVALEGVSHFLLMAHRAAHDRPVTQLELELQAEVDKYVMARRCPWGAQRQLSAPGEEPRVTAKALHLNTGPDPQEVECALFEGYTLAPHLGEEQAQRYVTASKLAQRYCRRLERDFLRENREDDLQRDLAKFYRQTQAARLHHIGY